MPEVEVSSISDKIRKLLSLAEGNKNEHERDAAMKLAMDLLSKYNLDLAKVKDGADDNNVVEIKVLLKLDPWIRAVLHAACKLYYTSFFMRPEFRGYYRDRKEWHPTFVGTKENIEVTMDVAAWLMHSIRLESNYLYTEQYERRSFRLGAAHRLYERACQLIDEEKQLGSAHGGNSLILLRDRMVGANERYKKKKNLGTFQSRGSYYDGEAYGQGESFADTVNLGKNTSIKSITVK